MKKMVIDGIEIPNIFEGKKKVKVVREPEPRYEQDHYNSIDGIISFMTGAFILFALLTLMLVAYAPKTETTNYMYETKIISVDYNPPHYRRVGKVNRFFPAEYWVCFAYKDRTFCGNNKTIFDRNQFDGVVNIIVSVDVETQIKDGKFVGFHNVRIIEDTDN